MMREPSVNLQVSWVMVQASHQSFQNKPGSFGRHKVNNLFVNNYILFAVKYFDAWHKFSVKLAWSYHSMGCLISSANPTENARSRKPLINSLVESIRWDASTRAWVSHVYLQPNGLANDVGWCFSEYCKKKWIFKTHLCFCLQSNSICSKQVCDIS